MHSSELTEQQKEKKKKIVPMPLTMAVNTRASALDASGDDIRKKIRAND